MVRTRCSFIVCLAFAYKNFSGFFLLSFLFFLFFFFNDTATTEIYTLSLHDALPISYFLYSTVYSNGEPFAVITEKNELYPELRTLSTKAAFGWHYVYPDSPYAQQIFDKVKDTSNSGRGYFAGIYESGLNDPSPPLNDILTGNTNGLLLEILYYKARGNQPLIGSSGVSVSSGQVGGEHTAAVPAEPPPSEPPPPSEQIGRASCRERV